MPTEVKSNTILIVPITHWPNDIPLCLAAGRPAKSPHLMGDKYRKPRLKMHNQEMRLI